MYLIKFEIQNKLQNHLLNGNQELYIISFWISLKECFPGLFKMSLDLLNPPIFSVPSESLFSIAGLILDKKRSRLSVEYEIIFHV